jgi:hypothetical protein
MTHLSSDEFVDAVEGCLDPAKAAHAQQCPACRTEVVRLAAMLQNAADSPVPEPSPLFWTHFSQRVHDAIAAEETPRTSWMPRWLRWPVLAPVGVLAFVIFAIIAALPRPQSAPPPQQAVVEKTDTVDDLATLGEQEWAVVAEIVGAVDIDAAHDAGFVALGDAERVALQLSADEQRELLRLLQEEMEKSGG